MLIKIDNKMFNYIKQLFQIVINNTKIELGCVNITIQ